MKLVLKTGLPGMNPVGVASWRGIIPIIESGQTIVAVQGRLYKKR